MATYVGFTVMIFHGAGSVDDVEEELKRRLKGFPHEAGWIIEDDWTVEVDECVPSVGDYSGLLRTPTDDGEEN
jgi:hypothetical protein